MHYALLGMKHICKVAVYSSAVPSFSYWKSFAILSETEASEECVNLDGIVFVTHTMKMHIHYRNFYWSRL